MVRLMLTLTPITSVLSGLAVSTVLDTYLKEGPIQYPFQQTKKGYYYYSLSFLLLF